MSVDFNPSNLRRKSILRDTSGNIITWLDETDGGYIVRNRQVVNQEKWNAILKAEEDKKLAAQASAEQVSAPKHIEDLRAGKKESTPNPQSKVDELEKKVDNMESKLDAILAKLK
jgi:hypothetical protein